MVLTMQWFYLSVTMNCYEKNWIKSRIKVVCKKLRIEINNQTKIKYVQDSDFDTFKTKCVYSNSKNAYVLKVSTLFILHLCFSYK